ncbi:MAG: hypothetical protein HY521_03090 [Proteobacteria bacterium]|nr:hypothetical protein [Pseudomonadota bacterium]
MINSSPRSHLYRLGILLAVFFVVAAVARQWATPASWNYRDWYRTDALRDTELLPLAYGGNESCNGCHEKAGQTMRAREHKGLSCESCHGALADHVRADKKFAAAKVDPSRGQCLNCHAEDINKPRGFPLFSKEGAIGKFVPKHKESSETGRCLKCHDPHDPKT